MRNVIVSGGSRGLGLGIARALCAEGYRVVAIARRDSKTLTGAIREIAAGGSGELHFVPCDLAELEQIPGLIAGIRKQHGPIFGLVNNAGLGTSGLLATMRDADIERLVRLNTLSPLLLTKYAVRSMMAHGGGRIVNIASIVGFTGYSGLAAYGATKASLIGFTRSLAREVGRLGINVNAVAPGFIATDMTGEMTERERAAIARRSALQRMAEIADVANAVTFLVGDKARSITGTVVTVDAGSTA